jgi:hypothetical protein
MVKPVKKTLFSGLLAASAIAFLAMNSNAQGLQKAKLLQPQGLNQAGIYALRDIAPDLTGSGVKYAVICRSINYINGEPQNDYRPNIEHNCFKAGQFTFHDQAGLAPGISPHSTAICSIMFGEDQNVLDPIFGQFYYQGVAPKAQASIHEFWHFLINDVFHHSPPDADILVADFGWQFEEWWTRGIESLADSYGLIVVAGIGNGTNACDPPLFPGAAANVIGVGVVDSVRTDNDAANLAYFSLAYPEHSSLGPTPDGRCKPDIVAPGNCLAASANNPQSYEPTGNCSSFSTPIVAGTIGLLVQKAKQEPALSSAVSPQGGNCVIKAILLNSATKLPYWHKGRLQNDDDHVVPLDYAQGAGMLNAFGAYQQLIAGQGKPGRVSTTSWDLNHLDKNKNSTNTYKISVTDSTDKIITATVVWNRHYNTVYPFEPIPDKDANLRLELWAQAPHQPNKKYLLDYSDSNVDTVEHIYCRTAAVYTNYELVVSFSDTNSNSQIDETRPYGLAWNISDSHDSNNIFWYDLNADGIVNDLDFTILLDNSMESLKSPGSYLFGDINNDGTIDMNDLQTFLEHKNRQAPWCTVQQKNPDAIAQSNIENPLQAALKTNTSGL